MVAFLSFQQELCWNAHLLPVMGQCCLFWYQWCWLCIVPPRTCSPLYLHWQYKSAQEQMSVTAQVPARCVSLSVHSSCGVVLNRLFQKVLLHHARHPAKRIGQQYYLMPKFSKRDLLQQAKGVLLSNFSKFESQALLAQTSCLPDWSCSSSYSKSWRICGVCCGPDCKRSSLTHIGPSLWVPMVWMCLGVEALADRDQEGCQCQVLSRASQEAQHKKREENNFMMSLPFWVRGWSKGWHSCQPSPQALL